jgi:hypothetical protein
MRTCSGYNGGFLFIKNVKIIFSAQLAGSTATIYSHCGIASFVAERLGYAAGFLAFV